MAIAHPPPVLPAAPSFASAVANDAARATDLIRSQLAQPLSGQDGLIGGLALAVAGLALLWPVRLILIRLMLRLLARLDPGRHCYAHARAIITIFGTVLLFGFGIHLLRSAIGVTIVLLPTVAILADTVAAGLVLVGFGLGLARALWPPDRADPAPLPLPQSSGRRVAIFPLAGAILLALAGFVERASTLLHASPASSTLTYAVAILLQGGLVVAFLVTWGRLRDAEGAAKPGSASFTLTALAWGAVVVGLAAWLLGYTRFAALLFQELIWASMVGATGLLLARLAEGLLAWLLGSERAAGSFAVHVVGLARARIDQVRIVATGIVTILIWLVTIALMLAPLGGKDVSLVDQIRPSLLLGELRNLHVDPRAVATAILVLAVGIGLTRLVRRWLQERFLPATSLHAGVRSSIVTGIGYAGILLALLAATNALGIALDKVTLIASALSVGIGFGLQSIIQNFVSGVIVLIERPIEVGDWVLASGVEGSVRRIRVRATEIAMPDGSIAIVPNSSFISANVQNRTAAGLAGRIDVTVKVASADDPAATREAIIGIAKRLDTIGGTREPKLLLTDAGQDSLGFVLQVYTKGQRPSAEAKSELLYALADALRESGIKAALS